VALLREIGARHGVEPTPVALAWLMANESVLPIPGAKNARQATANAEALTVHLSADEVEALDAVTTAWRTRS
jgi:aryl-alcohol dehydrogenase-like predicted oxidoreductase